jgi:hypothetical protein
VGRLRLREAIFVLACRSLPIMPPEGFLFALGGSREGQIKIPPEAQMQLPEKSAPPQRRAPSGHRAADQNEVGK